MNTSDPIDLAMGAKIPVDFKGIHAVKIGKLDVSDLKIKLINRGRVQAEENSFDCRWPISFDSLAIWSGLRE